jgi:hypothetical protein
MGTFEKNWNESNYFKVWFFKKTLGNYCFCCLKDLKNDLKILLNDIYLIFLKNKPQHNIVKKLCETCKYFKNISN